jgi:maltose alpha-D-glucosyltransferase/alpha-amylase
MSDLKITGKYSIPPCPEWVHNAVFYQIYPQTFYDSDGDGIGDLQGIIEKLDYVKSLGVDGIWINPFFVSPFYDAGYDIADYYQVAPRYGTNEDARRLFEEAHKRGLKVLFDFVASYTSIEHPWFKESCKQEKNTFSNWYIWTESTWEPAPEAFQDRFIQGYARRDGQFMRNFYWCQPALNFGFANPKRAWQLPMDHPDVLALREELKKVVRFWMDMGADGFRADMAGALVKSENIEGDIQFFRTQDEGTKSFWREIRHIFDTEYPQGFMVSEWSHPQSALDGCFHVDFHHWFDGYNDLLQKESWRILNGRSEGHSFFDQDGKGNIANFLQKYLEQYLATRDKGYISLPLGNHDLARLSNQRTDDELEMIFAFLLTMPGVPFIYYGNELGMRQLSSDLPHVEGAYKPRAGARTPMQWAKEKNAGFSTAAADSLYLPVDNAEDFPNVAEQEQDPTSLLNRVKRLIQLKKQEKALAAYAEFVPVFAKENTYPFIYARAAGDDVILVILNPAGRKADAVFSCNMDLTGKKLLSGQELQMDVDGDEFTVSIPAQSYAVYKYRLA